jgi:diguanylate cyclase (GGDEF)-like protein/PAS domain S-box-containing protein
MPRATSQELHNRHSHKAISTTRTMVLLSLGFLLSTSLFAILIGYGLNKLQASQLNIKDIVHNHNVKADLIVTMHNAARERSMGLYRMSTTEDPFERDDLFLEFNRNGARFANARIALTKMALSPVEQQIIAEQGQLTSIAVPLQNQVVDLVQNDEIRGARLLLNEKAMPAQNNVLSRLNKLQEYQRLSAANITRLTDLEQQRARQLILVLGGLAILFSTLIAIYIIRRVLRIERRMFLEKEQAELTLYSIGDAVITTDEDGNIQLMNPRAEDITGYSFKNAVGRSLTDVFHVLYEYNHEPIPDPLEELFATGKIVKSSQTEVLIDREKQEFAIEHTVAPIKDINGKIIGAIIIFRDETENRALASKLSYQASHDMLTGLVNRHEFESRLKQIFPVIINENIPYAVCYLDLDQFKIINDTCGHHAGDELLKQVAQILKQNLRRSDLLARLGGDEFGILLEGCSIEKAQEIAESLIKAVNDFNFPWNEQIFDIGASIGVAPITNVSASVSELLSAADSACYVAKDTGRNRVHVYHPDDSELERHVSEMQWVGRINSALENDRFILYYQPILKLDGNNSDMHHEILLRMLDEEHNLISPMAFIPAAERYNLMSFIDRWVVKKTFAQLNENNHYSDSGHIFTINISGQSLSARGFTDFVIDQFSQNEISPEQICIEITETAAISNMSHAIDFITRLKEIGCRFSLDDFGSGLSSFSYLKHLPVDFIKIDGSFVRDICEDAMDRAFVESIAQIGHVMHIKTIAEFVENQDIQDKLKSIGVDYAQGYHIGKPQPLSQYSPLPASINRASATTLS